MKQRADRMVVNKGLAESPQKAQALIMAGMVYSEGQRVEKAGHMLDADQEIFLKEKLPYVSRGGLKLEEALDSFQIPVKGKVAADLGASTGGFTDCLLQRGAERVYAVDVDTRQMDWHLRENPQIILIEKNARYLKKNDFTNELDIVTIDLSFISVLKVLPAVKEFLGEGTLISLIKPQFEVRKSQVGKKGIVRDPVLHEEVLSRIVNDAEEMGFHVKGLMKPSVRGQKGNQEFFISWVLKKKGQAPFFNKKVPVSLTLKTIIKEAVWNAKN